jgi:hypothetical protein
MLEREPCISLWEKNYILESCGWKHVNIEEIRITHPVHTKFGNNPRIIYTYILAVGSQG